MVWAVPGYIGSSIHLYVVSSVGINLLPDSINGQPVGYKLVMTYHPSTYIGPTEFIIPTSPNGRLLADIELPNTGAIGLNPLDSNYNQVIGYRFNLVTPEPGCLLVLGSVIVRLLGLARLKK